MNKSFTLLFFAAILFSCTKNEIDEVDKNPEDEKTYITYDEIKGIWIDKNNENFFLKIDTDERYSFCLSQEIMGSGKYTLEKDSIVFYNNYLSTTDKAKIEVRNNNLILKGDFKLFKQTKSTSIDIQFIISNEETPVSIIGEQWKSNKILNINGDRREYLDVLTENIIKYRLVKANSIETLIKEQNWFYINRKDLLYTQINNGDGKIHLYKNPFIYESLTGISSFEIDFSE